MSMLSTLKQDCQILLDRALLGHDVACFGIDGNGLHGQTYQGQTYKITKIEVEVDQDEDDQFCSLAWIYLDGYQASKFGHICTDKNFELSVNLLLKAQIIDPTCWEWVEVDLQEETGVVLKIDVVKLLVMY